MTYEDEIREKMDEERQQLESSLEAALKIEPKLAKEHAKAAEAAHKLAKKNFDAEPSEKEKALGEEARAKMSRLLKVGRTIALCRNKLALLEDPAELERRVQALGRTRERIGSMIERQGGKVASGESRPRRAAAKVDVPENVVNRIVKAIREGAGVQLLSKQLAKEKVEPYKEGWDRTKVASVVKKKTGMSMAEFRKQHPLAQRGEGARSRAASSEKSSSKNSTAAKKSSTTARKSVTASARSKSGPAGRGGKKTTQPHPKAEQAAGTSRGGTGKRKPPEKARSRTSAARTRRKRR